MTGKRVLFVEQNLRSEKLGIMYLSAALKSCGHHAEMARVDQINLSDYIRDYKPDFVAFSIATGEHTPALATARRIKSEFGIPNIFGGPHCTFFPEFSDSEGVDFAIAGQGELAIVDVVEGRKPKGFSRGAAHENLDALPFPDREIFYMYDEFRDNPMKNVITSRSCPYQCSYCFNHSYLAISRQYGETKQWLGRRSPANVLAEIEQIRSRYPLEQILYIDDNFLQGKKWLNDYIQKYTEAVHLPWLCSLRVNLLDRETIDTMVSSDLTMVNYALESADPDVQKYLLNRGQITNGDIIQAISLFREHGIKARMQNMIGLPLQNPLEDALNTLQFNLHHRVDDSWCSIFQPYPRTALGQYCVEHGYISKDQINHCSDSFFDESRLRIPNRNELYNLQKLWYFIVEAGMPIDLVQILIRGTLPKDAGNQLQELRFKCSREKLYGLQTNSEKSFVSRYSRESLRERSSEDSSRSVTFSLLFKVMEKMNVPPLFVEYVADMVFEESDIDKLKDYMAGELREAPPRYTVDDTTGELKDPAISILRRSSNGTALPDLRSLPDNRFIGDIVEVYNRPPAIHHPC